MSLLTDFLNRNNQQPLNNVQPLSTGANTIQPQTSLLSEYMASKQPQTPSIPNNLTFSGTAQQEPLSVPESYASEQEKAYAAEQQRIEALKQQRQEQWQKMYDADIAAQEKAAREQVVPGSTIMDIRDPRASSAYLPTDTSVMSQLKNGIMDMWDNDPQTRFERMKEYFGPNFVSARMDKNGNVIMMLNSSEGKREFYMDAPNWGNETWSENLWNTISDVPDFAFESIKYVTGAKALGLVGAGLAEVPYVGRMFQLSRGAGIPGKLADSLRSSFKAGLTQAGSETALNLTKNPEQTRGASGVLGEGIYEAGATFLGEVALKTILGLPFINHYLTSPGKRTVGNYLYGNFGGDKDMAKALGALPEVASKKEIVKGMLAGKAPGEQRAYLDLISASVPDRELASKLAMKVEQGIGQIEEATALKNFLGDLKDNASRVKELFINDLKINGNIDDMTLKTLERMSPEDILNQLGKQSKLNTNNVLNIQNDYELMDQFINGTQKNITPEMVTTKFRQYNSFLNDKLPLPKNLRDIKNDYFIATTDDLANSSFNTPKEYIDNFRINQKKYLQKIYENNLDLDMSDVTDVISNGTKHLENINKLLEISEADKFITDIPTVGGVAKTMTKLWNNNPKAIIKSVNTIMREGKGIKLTPAEELTLKRYLGKPTPVTLFNFINEVSTNFVPTSNITQTIRRQYTQEQQTSLENSPVELFKSMIKNRQQ